MINEIPGMKNERIKQFALCYTLYIMVHCCRSTWSYASGLIIEQNKLEGFTPQFLGYVNFTFLLSMGVSYFLLGQLGDKINPKLFVIIGTYPLSALFIILALIFEFTTAPKELYLVLLLLAGMFSSTAWPGLLSIMNAWMPKEQKGIILGVFASCINVGNIAGFANSGITIEICDLSILTPIYISGGLLFFMTILFHIFIKPRPPIISEHIISDTSQEPQVSKEVVGVKKLKIWKAWLLPGVAIYALAFGCIKAISMIVGLWLPAYLDYLHVTYVALINIMLDLGAGFGGVIVCYLGVRYQKRATIIVPLLWLGTILMVAINFLKDYDNPYGGYMALNFGVGFFIGGCYNNVAAAIAVELSNNKALKKYKHATSTVTSLIMGYGTLFGALNQIIVPYVKDYLFLYCGILAVVGGLLLIVVIITEWKLDDEPEKLNKEIEMH
ncbi:unnamed protein product [Paramecium pentaurelia]|uniref:Major facilitator superfamily (MFS) profile domain-containing protein n=1 Tax=Paramecium pentaurelia TaxID=43138 RepID=A0A8S1WZT7_9CILI|nr:unnamed protein product [Paramecium pentaurelia]